MKKAFTIVELVIVIMVLGIIAAIVIPIFQSHTQKAKEAAAKDDLRILRNIIEIYAAKYGIAPGYPDNDQNQAPQAVQFTEQIITSKESGDTFKGSIYKFPKNPFNNKDAIRIILNDEKFPADAEQTDIFGWVYQPSTKNIRLNWSGMDSEGIRYFDY